MNQDCQKHKRAVWTKGVVIGLLLISTALDFFTFAANPQFWDFDMSMLVIFTNNMALITIVKFGVVLGLIYMLLYSRSNDCLKYIWIMAAVYLIFAQSLGAIANRQVAEQNPPQESAPPPEVRAKVGINFALIWGYYPMLFGLVSFWIWNWGWRET